MNLTGPGVNVSRLSVDDSGHSSMSATTSSSSDSVGVNGLQIPIENMDLSNNIKLGRGTYGIVERSKMKDPMSGEMIYVAVKFVHEEQNCQALRKEARVMQSLKGHPNVIDIYGMIRTASGRLGLVMEYMDCKMIRKPYIKYEMDHVISWLYQLADAVSYFHSKNKLHRDLKLQNLLLANCYHTLKVGDYGTFTPQRDTMQSLHGTPITMAPEIFRQERYDAKCDVYSIGIIMWQLIARSEPYITDASAQVLLWNVAACGKRPPDIDCHPYLSKFYKRCWDDKPERRPTSREVLKYFSLLKTVYTNGTKPLFDTSTNEPVRPHTAPMSNLVPSARAHRRTASDQTNQITLKSQSQMTSDMDSYRTTAMAGERRAQSTTPTKSRNATAIPTFSNQRLGLSPEDMPAPARIGDPLSQEIHRNHSAQCNYLMEVDRQYEAELQKKHHFQMKIKQFTAIKELLEHKEQLIKNRDNVLMRIQHQS